MKKNPAAVSLGRLGGQAKSDPKTTAARANGAKGGRPPKPIHTITVSTHQEDVIYALHKDGEVTRGGRVLVEDRYGGQALTVSINLTELEFYAWLVFRLSLSGSIARRGKWSFENREEAMLPARIPPQSRRQTS